MMTRNEALALVKQHLQNPNLVKHCLAAEAIMRALAQKFGEDEERWGLAGLLHDLDFAETAERPDQHGRKTAEILRTQGFDEEFVTAVLAHNAEGLGMQRTTRFQHCLAAAETITGLIVATALVYPDRRLASVRPDSIVKRMKKKDFARNVSREIIRECEQFGMSVPDFAALSLQAMQAIAGELGL